jgi:hypothetical protein
VERELIVAEKINQIKFNEIPLTRLLDELKSNNLALPYFQRGFVWQTKGMKSLLSSLLLGLPIGSILVLDPEGDDNHKFAARSVEGVEETGEIKGQRYLLDGQQRLTSLFSIYNKIDRNITRSIKLRQRWFLAIDLFKPRDKSFEFVPLDHYEPEDVEEYIQNVSNEAFFDDSDDFLLLCKNKRMIPMDYFYPESDSSKKRKIQRILIGIAHSYLSDFALDSNDDDSLNWAVNSWVMDVASYISSTLDQHVMALEFNTQSFERAIQAFEILNKSGIKLHIFDLLVARAGRVNVDSGEESVENFYDKVLNWIDPNKNGQLTDQEIQRLNSNCEEWTVENFYLNESDIPKNLKDQIVNILTVLYSINTSLTISNKTLFEVDVKRSAEFLNLNIDDAMKRLIRTFAFLQLRCGVKDLNSLSYKLITLPIASVIDDFCWNDKKQLDKIEAWYWTVVLSGRYRYDQSTVTKIEVERLKNIIKSEDKIYFNAPDDLEPRDYGVNLNVFEILNIKENYFDKNNIPHDSLNLAALKTLNSSDSIYKCICQYIISQNPPDFIIPQKINAWDTFLKLNDHHIIPLYSAKKISESTQMLRKQKDLPQNSILNRTMITEVANKKIGQMDFHKYRDEISDAVLYEHFIVAWSEVSIPEDFNLKGSEEQFFERFLESRYHLLKNAIQKHVRELIE